MFAGNSLAAPVFFFMALVVTGACSKQLPAGPLAADGGGAATARNTSEATSAQRCGECHREMETQWRGSAHARAAVSPLYRAMKQQAGAAGCDACHAPLASRTHPDSRVISEGVTCDVCHTLTEVAALRKGASFVLALEDNVKYGPFCDLKDHYFHKMGCSPKHQESEFCGGCHLLYERNGTLPVYTEYEEWAQGSAAANDTPCQSCHMPEGLAAIAVGSPPRSGVNHHGLFGEKGRLRQQAIRGEVRVSPAPGGLHLEIALRNSGAGHAIPSGMPGRRVVLRAEALDTHGALQDAREIEYARVLVDSAGVEAPFYLATRLGADTRLGVGAKRLESFDLRAPKAGVVVIRVIWRGLSAALSARVHASPEAEEVMASAHLEFGPWEQLQRRAPEILTARIN